jgi:hypothetical protein
MLRDSFGAAVHACTAAAGAGTLSAELQPADEAPRVEHERQIFELDLGHPLKTER